MRTEARSPDLQEHPAVRSVVTPDRLDASLNHSRLGDYREVQPVPRLRPEFSQKLPLGPAVALAEGVRGVQHPSIFSLGLLTQMEKARDVGVRVEA